MECFSNKISKENDKWNGWKNKIVEKWSAEVNSSGKIVNFESVLYAHDASIGKLSLVSRLLSYFYLSVYWGKSN